MVVGVVVAGGSLLHVWIGAVVVLSVFDAEVCSLRLWTGGVEVVVGIGAF